MLLILAGAGAYGAFMYVYTENMFAPVPLLTAPQTQAPHTPGLKNYTRFIHRVNTPARAKQKDKYFDGFETDVWENNGTFLAAHDEQEAQHQTALGAVFEAVANPAQKIWWLDLKQELSAEQLETLLQIAENYKIPPENLFFESVPGPTAALLAQRGLNLLLQLPEGFNEDGADEKRRAAINQQMLALWEQYRPAAVSASFGKYGHLKAYFPDMPKAIYYSATVRPSLKKPLMAARMKKDPSVKIFMTDEYTWMPL